MKNEYILIDSDLSYENTILKYFKSNRCIKFFKITKNHLNLSAL